MFRHPKKEEIAILCGLTQATQVTTNRICNSLPLEPVALILQWAHFTQDTPHLKFNLSREVPMAVGLEPEDLQLPSNPNT